MAAERSKNQSVKYSNIPEQNRDAFGAIKNKDEVGVANSIFSPFIFIILTCDHLISLIMTWT